MTSDKSALAGWTPAEIEIGKQWVETWEKTGIELERIRRSELRELDTFAAIVKLCADYDYRVPACAKTLLGIGGTATLIQKIALE